MLCQSSHFWKRHTCEEREDPEDMSKPSPKKKFKLFGNTDKERLEELDRECPPTPLEIPRSIDIDNEEDDRLDFVVDVNVKLSSELKARCKWFQDNKINIRPIRQLGPSSGRTKKVFVGNRFYFSNRSKFPVRGHWVVKNKVTYQPEPWILLAVPTMHHREFMHEWVPLEWALSTKHAPDVVYYIFKYKLIFCNKCWHNVGSKIFTLTVDRDMDREENLRSIRKGYLGVSIEKIEIKDDKEDSDDDDSDEDYEEEK